MFDSWNNVAQLVLIVGWFLGSTLVWGEIARRRVVGLPAVEPHVHPVARMPWGVEIGAILWLAFQIGNKFAAAGDAPREISLFGVQFLCGVNLLIAVLLPLALTEGGRRPPAEFGLSSADWQPQIQLGVRAFFAAVWPTALMLLISTAWRNDETQHSLLRAVRNPEKSELIAWIVLSAVIAAPLAEELLFRLVLQSWLVEWLPVPAAIGVTAAIFALIHGWRDALPLLPLALVLGYVFHQSRSYWACVTTHALFNASNLAMVLLAEA